MLNGCDKGAIFYPHIGVVRTRFKPLNAALIAEHQAEAEPIKTRLKAAFEQRLECMADPLVGR